MTIVTILSLLTLFFHIENNKHVISKMTSFVIIITYYLTLISYQFLVNLSSAKYYIVKYIYKNIKKSSQSSQRL